MTSPIDTGKRSRTSALDRLLTVAALLAVPVMLLGLWKGSGGIRSAIGERIRMRRAEALVDSLSSAFSGHAFLGSESGQTYFEFMDYECPVCRASREAVNRVVGSGPPMRLIVMHFPLETIHASARLAAGLSICAEKEGRFAEAHDLLLRIALQSDSATLIRIVSDSLGIKRTQIDECLVAPETWGRIQRDQALGRRLGVLGTPTFVAPDGRLLSIGQLSAGIRPGVARRTEE